MTIAYSISLAIENKFFDEIMVLTDDFEIVEKAKKNKVSALFFRNEKNQICSLYKLPGFLSIGNSISNVTSLDQGHLSDLAAEYFIEVSEKKIFGNEY